MDKGDEELYKSILNALYTPPSGGLNNLRALADLSKRTIPPEPPAPNYRGLLGIISRTGLRGIEVPPPAPAVPKPTPPAKPSIEWAKLMVGSMMKRRASITAGRVLPGIDDLAVMEGRKIRAAFVYSDLHGFTKLVATQPENKSFVFLHTFVEIASRITKHYGGEVMDVAGDRVLSVFHRTTGNLSNEPVEDAVKFALWLQTVFSKAISPTFAADGLPQMSLGIGIDYGEAVVGCVGIRNNKRIVFFGDAANYAAKLQEIAGPGETILSPDADARRPRFLDNGTWGIRRELLNDGNTVLRTTHISTGDQPL